ncbi:hypothetical protein IV203_012905 [Nitzschia inconspicua]|uniref:Uncharacterized protein n=1 Tax=Nitzschia inconspicua TaxID=303405 RepID=A0A9K3Q8C0_9STRA|nr:hypothetical protein IV203_012905 [Nitzschia inconspicua]
MFGIQHLAIKHQELPRKISSFWISQSHGSGTLFNERKALENSPKSRHQLNLNWKSNGMPWRNPLNPMPKKWKTLGGISKTALRTSRTNWKKPSKRIHKNSKIKSYFEVRTTKSLEESFVRNVLKQRHGFEKWFRTIRNHLLFILGGMTNFSGGLTTEAASRAIIFQTGFHTWLILNMFGNANSNVSSEEADSRTSDIDTHFPKSGFRKLRHCATKVVMKLRQITRSILFKDAIAFLTAAYVAKQKIPPTCHSLLETGLPIATIVHAMVRTVRKIVRILQDRDVWKQQQQ